MELTPWRKVFLFGLPVLLTASTAFAFSALAQWLGSDAGYLLGFVVYWLWCLGVPLVLLGKEGAQSLLQDRAPLFRKENWLPIALLALTVAGAVVMYTIPSIASVSPWVVLFSPIAIVNGTCEEILWRGVYVKAFGRNFLLACLYPALGFAISHLSSELVFPAEGGVAPFIVSTFFLGLAYGYVAYRRGSALWTALAHSLIGLLAFGEPLSTSIVRLLAR